MDDSTIPVAGVVDAIPAILIRVECPYCGRNHQHQWIPDTSIAGPRIARCQGWRKRTERNYYHLNAPV
jgi:hypothetical protein